MERPFQFTIREVRWREARAVLAAIREEVFVREQKVPEELEWDGLDDDCVHVLAQTLEGRPIGTARLLPDGHIGRMAVVKEWRRRGVGSALLNELLERAKSRGLPEVRLNAQVSARGFYLKHGFVAVGGEFLDAGIPHVEMVLRV
jgi:predicted GNAT family N-acyltransferase